MSYLGGCGSFDILSNLLFTLRVFPNLILPRALAALVGIGKGFFVEGNHSPVVSTGG